MSRGQSGNKEAKKPKKVHLPNPPGLPAGLVPVAPHPQTPGKRR